MNKIHVSIRYKGSSNLQLKIQTALKLRRLISALKEESKINLRRIDDLGCEFEIAVSDDGDMTPKKLNDIIRAHINVDEFEINMAEQQASHEGAGLDLGGGSTPTGGDTPADGANKDDMTKLGRGLDLGGGDAPADGGDTPSDNKDRHDKKAAPVGTDWLDALSARGGQSAAAGNKGGSVLEEINSLIGNEAFKKKAQELARIAPRLKNIDGYFLKNRFLFAIDNGSGLTTAVSLFAKLLASLGLIRRAEVNELPEIPNHEDVDKFKQETGEILRMANKNAVTVIDLSKCYNNLKKEFYREFLTILGTLPNCPILVFRIPYLDNRVSRDVVESLSDQFFMHYIPFVPASLDELYAFACRAVKELGYSFADDVREIFNHLVAVEKRDGRFYGYKTVEKLVYALVYEKARIDQTDSSVICAADLESMVSTDVIDHEDGTGMEQLDRLTGMDNVVTEIKNLVNTIELSRRNPKSKPCFHLRFVGSPGTGKTTVARILGKILKERGILRTGVFFEYNGNDFIGRYVGHSAPKTAQLCRDAYGGVLFIDEAYALSPGSDDNDSFRREALSTLIAEMENHRGDMIVIMAGYKDEIDELMQHNPGLEQRMPYSIDFENFSREALADIFLSMASKGCHYEEEFETTVRSYFANLSQAIYYSETFSNARYVRNLYERTLSKAGLRAQFDKSDVPTLLPIDLQKAVEEIERTATSSPRMAKNKSGATMFREERAKIKFADVCGQDGAKALLMELVDCLKNPHKYEQMNVKIPKGALLYGPPGTGKTMMAKAVAGEAGVPVLTISGSDFIGQYHSEGAERVKALFEKARKIAPCIVFVDEIDAIGVSREAGNSSTALLQLLTEMDGFEDDKTIVVLAATNRPECLDPALRRPGRFDRDIPLELPEQEGRVAILKYHLDKKSCKKDVDLNEVATMTRGFSGAALANVVNEAAFRVIRANRDIITTKDLLDSAEAISVGDVKEGITISEHEKWVICYHEIGHALTTALLTDKVTVKKITVVPRTGGVLGFASHADAAPSFISTKSDLENEIAGLIGGRAAEEVHFHESSTGASNDIKVATRIARSMVATYGMTDQFDMTAFDVHSGGYLGSSTKQTCSDATAKEIDEAVVEIIRTQHARVLKLLEENVELLDALAAHIYEHENITGDEFMQILAEKKKKA